MKSTNIERTYMDFTSGSVGIRIWRDRAKAIAREDASTGWVEQGNVFMIPVPERVLAVHRCHSDAPVRAIARNAGLYESRECDLELRKLLQGRMTFDQALTTVSFAAASAIGGGRQMALV